MLTDEGNFAQVYFKRLYYEREEGVFFCTNCSSSFPQQSGAILSSKFTAWRSQAALSSCPGLTTEPASALGRVGWALIHLGV